MINPENIKALAVHDIDGKKPYPVLIANNVPVAMRDLTWVFLALSILAVLLIQNYPSEENELNEQTE